MIRLLLVCVVALQAATRPSSRPGGEIVPPPRRDVPGQRIKLSCGELFLPDFYKSRDKADVLIHFLGAPWCVEQIFYAARKNAVLLVADPKIVKEGFRTPEEFDALLGEISKALGNKPLGKICLSSFSGGYTAVRDLLRFESVAARVSDVVLLDSLYAARVRGSDKNDVRLDPTAIQPFLDFARRATNGQTRFFFTHLYPPKEQYRGNTTTLAANALIDALKLERITGTGQKNSRGAALLYHVDRDGLHILGYAGMTNQDHFDHLYSAADVWKLTALADLPPNSPAAK